MIMYIVVLLIDVFWWIVLNTIIVFFMYKGFSLFRHYYYGEPIVTFKELFGLNTKPYKPNLTTDFSRKYKKWKQLLSTNLMIYLNSN